MHSLATVTSVCYLPTVSCPREKESNGGRRPREKKRRQKEGKGKKNPTGKNGERKKE